MDAPSDQSVFDENERRIQNLRDKRTQATIELSGLAKEKAAAQRQLDGLNKKVNNKATQIRAYSAEIGAIKTGEKKAKVTDHAIVRYLERYKNFDIESIANEILEHPDAKLNNSGIVSTVFKEEPSITKDASDILRIARMKKII